MNLKSLLRKIPVLVVIAFVLTGCAAPKNIAYFQDAKNASVIDIVSVQANAIKVEPFDKLSIIVYSQDPALSKIFNLGVVSNAAARRESYTQGVVDFRNSDITMNEGISAFTVSAQGTIEYPVLGQLKVSGMTRSELAAFIKGELEGRGLVKDPVVTVEFLNTGVSVLGEVLKPGLFEINSDVITILDALSLAGDLTIQGQRENITVLRHNGDKIETYLVDITDTKKMLESPAYFLKQGDVVYVEPNGMRKRQTTSNGTNLMNLSFWISVASLLTSVALLFIRK